MIVSVRPVAVPSLFLSPEAHITHDAALSLTSSEVHQRLANACRATEKQKRSDLVIIFAKARQYLLSHTLIPVSVPNPLYNDPGRVNGAW